MAGKLMGVGVSGGGNTGYAFIQYNSLNQVWNGAVFESWLDAHYSTYLTVATEEGTSGVYFGDEVNAATRYVMRKKVGGTPSTDPIAWEDNIEYDTDIIGPYAVTISFVDQASTPVPNVPYSIPGVGQGRSDSSGVATIGMYNGSYEVVAAVTNGITFPTTALVVSGTTSLTVQGSGGAAITPSPPGFTTGYLYTRDGQGNILPDCTLAFTLVAPNKGKDAWNNMNFTATSDGNGLLQVQLLVDAEYRVTWPTGEDTDFTTGSGATFPIPEVLGSPT
jgi:hypothetical protein